MPGHDHARDPEEEDVVARLQHGGRIEAAQVGRVVRPAERAERPEPRAEPGVQHVGVLLELSRCRSARRSSGPRALTVISPQSAQYQTGMRWPHQSWREMFQSRMFSSQSV